jgi:hypothetical protein
MPSVHAIGRDLNSIHFRAGSLLNLCKVKLRGVSCKPVLSDRMVLTMPSSSFRLEVLARAGVSVSSWYIAWSLLMNTSACTGTVC